MPLKRVCVLFFLLLCCSLTFSASASLSAVVFSDNFNNGTIDTNKWLSFSGDRVAEEDGIMKIETNTTDNGGSLYSQIFKINNKYPIIITKNTKVHYANSYFQGGTAICLGQKSPESASVITFGIIYDNYFNTDPPKIGFYIVDWAHPGGSDPYGNISEPTQPIWDQWFNEKIIYNPISGMAQYYINGQLRLEKNVGPCPEGVTTMSLNFGGNGWYTGHYHYFDDLVVIQNSSATKYRFTTMDVPGYTDTRLSGINDSGQMSGYCGTNSQNIAHGVYYDGGQFTAFDVPGAEGKTNAAAIDANGRIVGYYSINNVNHGFEYDHGTFVNPLDFPNATNTLAFGINNQSQIVGYSLGSPNGQIGFLYSGGTYSPISAPASEATLALGINDACEIIGYYGDSSHVTHGFILNNDVYTTIDNPNAAGTILYGKNAANQIVGACRDSNGKMHGFLYDGKTFTTIEPPGALQSWARSINNRSQIVGFYIDQNNIYHGFLANPVSGSNAVYQLLLLD